MYLAFPASELNAATSRLVGNQSGVAITLHCAVDDERDWLCELYASTRETEMAMVPWTDAQKAAFLAQQFSLQHHHFVTHYPSASFDIVRAGDVPIGRLYVDRTHPWTIIDIALLPAWQSRGIGRLLIEETLRQAHDVGADVDLHVAAHNVRARTLYERLGFVVTAMGEMHHAMRHPVRLGQT